jgi:hypothetical protein
VYTYSIFNEAHIIKFSPTLPIPQLTQVGCHLYFLDKFIDAHHSFTQQNAENSSERKVFYNIYLRERPFLDYISGINFQWNIFLIQLLKGNILLGTLSQGRQFYNHFWIEDTSGKTSGRNTILEILSQVWAFLKLFLIRRYFWKNFW